ncbi:MinD/ParA family protein [Effusibacillus dendaii]|uniref:Site-determining protein n=1 Tax=Effusibacillus dendaii TaxID=2743772 RepID=A0A7I8D9T2_9BACL|nr:MinD/ParA family protein [Effusibacillus dendaii]BCJ85280.1 site-determining protein [Effusibacillus dendaii]
MFDQAQRLRQIVPVATDEIRPATRVITITSGKGGVGKSNFSLNFALGLSACGKKVVVLDADVGFANIDVLMGQTPRRTLADLVQKKATIWEILELGPYGIHYIAGGSGLRDFLTLQPDQFEYLMLQLGELQGFADFLIIDTGAGMNQGTLRFILSSDDVIIVSTPEPTAITDAYALIKLITRESGRLLNMQLVVNRATSIMEAKQVAEKLSLVSKKFLNFDLKSLGYLLDDPKVSEAVKQQVPFFVRYPDSPASRCIDQLVRKQLKMPTGVQSMDMGIKSFLSRMRQVFRN